MFLKHKDIYFLTKTSRSGWYQAHSEVPLCHQGHTFHRLLCCPQPIDCLHLCCHIYGHKMAMGAPGLMSSLFCWLKGFFHVLPPILSFRLALLSGFPSFTIVGFYLNSLFLPGPLDSLVWIVFLAFWVNFSEDTAVGQLHLLGRKHCSSWARDFLPATLNVGSRS